MSDFPQLKYLLEESICEQASGHEPVRATNGALKMRRLYDSDKRTWTLVYMLDTASRATLMAHYGSNKDASFDFEWKDDLSTYTVSYSAAPQFTRLSPEQSRARVVLMER